MERRLADPSATLGDERYYREILENGERLVKGRVHFGQ
jgi:hypothetical protein